MRSLFEAIVHCHTFNVIHRDIKPANVMINENDIVKLIDFGLATQLKTSKLLKGASGTFQFMAPE